MLVRGKHISKDDCIAMHIAQVAKLLLARAVAQVLAQIFCPQCSRLHCLAQLNLLETLLAADWSCWKTFVLFYHADHIDSQHSFLVQSNLYCRSMYLVRTDSGGSNYGSKYPRQFAAGILLVESRQFAARILLVAHSISFDQNALDLAAELSEKFDNKNCLHQIR